MRSLRNVKRSGAGGLFLPVILVLVVVGSASAKSDMQGVPVPHAPGAYRVRDRTADLHHILTVIERRTNDGRVLERTKEKLPTLSDRDIRLTASLCERIVRDDGTAGADIAFTLVTALLVLS